MLELELLLDLLLEPLSEGNLRRWQEQGQEEFQFQHQGVSTAKADR